MKTGTKVAPEGLFSGSRASHPPSNLSSTGGVWIFSGIIHFPSLAYSSTHRGPGRRNELKSKVEKADKLDQFVQFFGSLQAILKET